MNITSMSGKFYEACRSRFVREMRYTHSLALKNEFEIKESKRLVDKAKEKCVELGICEEFYKKFCISYYDIYVYENEQVAIKSKCLKWMRNLQSQFGLEKISEPECLIKYGKCSYNCVDFECANEKQIELFEFGFNIDTGNDINIDFKDLNN